MVKKRTMRQTKYLLIVANIIVGIAIYFSLQKKDETQYSFNSPKRIQKTKSETIQNRTQSIV